MKFIQNKVNMNNMKMAMFLTNPHPFYAKVIKISSYFDIEIDGVIIGNIIVATKPIIYLNILDINVEHQRKGYGTQVVNFFKKFKKVIKIHCDMNDSNAIAFWEKMEFVRNEEDDLKLNPRETDKSFKWEI